MTNIVWTQSALQTLELVYLQTLQYTKNERIAAKLHNKLIKEAEMLRTFPNAGNILNTSERVTLCYRALVVDTNYKGEFYQFNLSSCIRQQNSLTAQFVSFSLSNLANIFYPPQFLQ